MFQNPEPLESHLNATYFQSISIKVSTFTALIEHKYTCDIIEMLFIGSTSTLHLLN